jgi:hypothetical protein
LFVRTDLAAIVEPEMHANEIQQALRRHNL